VWIVRLALRRPYTFTVMAILIVLMGIVTITRMATDIFPKIDIPVVSVIWSFPGVAPGSEGGVVIPSEARDSQKLERLHLSDECRHALDVAGVWAYFA
jgi:Cu/Ag efflux pump CusA